VDAKEARKTDVEDVRDHLAKMLEQGRSDDALELISSLLQRLKDENLRLAVELLKLMKQQTGRRSERISTEQLNLFLQQLRGQQDEADDEESDEPSDDETAADSDEADEDDPAPPSPPNGGKKKKPRRRPLPDHLPRETTIINVPEEQRDCPTHGPKVGIGYEESEVLHFRPASFWVERIQREKLACRDCEGEVAVAPAANKIVDGGMAGPGLVADLLIGKYRDHLPLSRQIKRYERLGVKLPSSTVGDWIGQGADLLEPLVKLETSANW